MSNAITDKLIESLGDPVDKNEYLISADKNGKWWIEHVYVGSAEPLEQWIEQHLKTKVDYE